MKTFILAVSLVAVAGTANALPIYKSTEMTCKQTQTVVKQNGSVILKHPGRYLNRVLVWDTYVSGRRYCRSGELIHLSSVPTLDKKSCRVLTCKIDDRGSRRGDHENNDPDPQ